MTEVIKVQTNINTPIRLKKLAKKLPEMNISLEDIPEIIIKLAPIDCANNKGKPRVILSNSMNLKYPKSQKKW